VGSMVTHRTLRVGMHICIPPLKPSHPSHLGKMGSKLRLEPSQSRHKRVTPAVTADPNFRY